MQDIFTQIRDLTSVIDEFGVRDHVFLQKPNEKTEDPVHEQVEEQVEEQLNDQEDDQVDEKTEQEDTEEKTLIEKIQLRFSDDFSELAGQFKVEEEVDSNKVEHVPAIKNTQASAPSSVASTTPTMTPAATPSSIRMFASSLKLPALPVTPPHKGGNRSRRTTLSSKSPHSFRTQNSDTPYRKKRQQENVSSQQYHARSYSEMMRIPDPVERLAFYLKTYDLCMRADSKLKLQIKRMQAKGLPKPMTEGYQPPPRPTSPEQMYPQTNPASSHSYHRGDTSFMNSSFSGSISMFLRKASMSSSRRTLVDTPKPSLTSRFTRSISRLTLSSRPTTRHPPRVAPFVDPPVAKRMPRASTSVPRHSKPPMPSPLVIENSHPSNDRRSASTLPSQGVAGSFTPQSAVSKDSARECNADPLSEMCNVLPQLDRRVLKEYLAEAGGDPMVAITLAVSQLKKLSPVSPTGYSARHDQLLYGG